MKPCDVTWDEQKIIEQINGDLKKKNYWKTQKKKKKNELSVRITLKNIVYFPQFVNQPDTLEYMYFQKEK
jgi:trehalose/maltose hydrolase-like predicted phosphorylase